MISRAAPASTPPTPANAPPCRIPSWYALENPPESRNIATTPGKVVYQNELMQLIQYAPSTPSVHKTPFLIIPPWINKYYILDLREKNSLVKWALDQGITVFVISWVNPDARLADKEFDDYLMQGTLAALYTVEKAPGEDSVNALGYCLGGTLLAATVGTSQAALQALYRPLWDAYAAGRPINVVNPNVLTSANLRR